MGCVCSTQVSNEGKISRDEEQKLFTTKDKEPYDRDLIFAGYMIEIETQLDVLDYTPKDMIDLIESYLYSKWQRFKNWTIIGC